ncbi:hypothetical protein, partial [Salmonella enterica]|uniref:hypothetical protein n=1 Tax=Salmonella enterica TaxID=28901 RepID=UPI0039EA0A78
LNFTCALPPPSGKIANQTACLPDVLDLLNNFVEDPNFLSLVNHKLKLVQNAQFYMLTTAA